MEGCGPGVEVDLAERATTAALLVANAVLAQTDGARELEGIR